MPVDSDAESDVSSHCEPESVIISSDDSYIPLHQPIAQQYSSSRMPGAITESQLSAMFSSTSVSGDEDLDKTIVEQPSTPATAVPGPSTRHVTIRKKNKKF